MGSTPLTARLKVVADSSLEYCCSKWGKRGLTRDKIIDDSISWEPNFFLKQNNHGIVGVEVTELPYPNILKIAAHDIRNKPFQVTIYAATPEEVFLDKAAQGQFAKLKADGFGLITVNESGTAILRHLGVPQSQHIQTDEFDKKLQKLSSRMKVCFRNAYDTYNANPGQGLQESGQIVEALVTEIARQADNRGMGSKILLAKTAADTIDNLYSENNFANHRAALGAARGFMRNFRNISSHPQKTAKQAAEKMHACRDGFLQAVAISEQLRAIFQQHSFGVRINI